MVRWWDFKKTPHKEALTYNACLMGRLTRFTYYIYRILQTGGMDTFRLISKDSFLATQPYLPILNQSRRRFLQLDIRETVGIVEMLDAV